MIRKKLLLFYFFGLLTKLNAGYYSSGFITYKHISGNRFNVIFQLTHDCRAIDPGSTQNLNVRDNINTNNSINLTMNRTSIKEISWNRNGACSSKNFGVQLMTYEKIIDLDSLLGGVLKSVCKIYMSAQMCCRNGAVNTFNPGNGYVTSMMDRCYVQNNSGPDIQNLHYSYFYLNNACYFNPIVADTLNNDFIEFEMVAPLNDFNSNETFVSPYSARYPITPFCSQSGQLNCSELPLSSPPRGLYFDSLNGNLVFTSARNSEVGNIVYKAKEYRYINGIKQLIGFFYVDNYFSTTLSGLTNPTITKSSLKLNHYFTAGKTGTIQIAIQHNDTNKLDSVVLKCFNPIKGSTVSITKKWRPDLTFTWQPKCEDIRKEPYIFYVYFINENSFFTNPQHLAINVYVQSDLELGNDTVICKNSTFILKSNINGQFKWNNSTSDTINTYTANQAGAYYLQVNRNGCLVYDSIKLKEITQKPNVYLGRDTVICNQSTNSTITIAAPYDPYVKYKWNRDTTNTYSFIYFKDTGWVSVKGVNVCGTSTDSIYVERNSSPRIKLPDDTLICNATYWQIQPVLIDNGTLLWDDFSVDSIRTVDSSGTYFLSIANNCGQDKDSIKLDFRKSPEFYLPEDTIVCNGNYPRFDLSSVDGDLLWSDNRKDKIYHAFKTGLLWAQASNVCGVFRDSVYIYNQSTPTFKPMRDTFLCRPFELILNPSCNSCDYLWNNQISNQSFTIQSSGVYTLWAGNFCGSYRDTITVDSDSFPYFTLPEDTTMKPVQLIIGPDKIKGKLVWSTGDTTSTISVTTEGIYWLSQSNACGEFTDTIYISEKASIVNSKLSTLYLYPNPAKDELIIESEKPIQSLELLNSNGQTLPLEVHDDNFICRLNLMDLNSGTYIVRIKIDGQLFYKYFLKL